MSKNPVKGLLALAALCACAAPAAAQVNPAQILAIKPKYDYDGFTTPAPANVAGCNVDVIKTQGGGSGYHLTDANKLTLRKFLDTDGDGRVDTWCFYRDGAEVYREALVGGKYSFRWIGNGGMKWGIGTVNPAGKAQIETWKAISPEEAAQEAYLALASGDVDRMKALMITPQEIQALGLPQVDAQKFAANQQALIARFQKTRGAFPNLPTMTFVRLESAQPGSYPADVTGGTQDVVKIARSLILFESKAQNKHEWMMTQELVQVGNAWRLTDVPAPDTGGGGGEVNPVLVALLKKLAEYPAPPPAGTGKLGEWTMPRVALLTQLAEVDEKEKESWQKQIIDNLVAAYLDKYDPAMPVLLKFKDHFVAAQPGGPMAAYASYREIWCKYQRIMSDDPRGAKIQETQKEYHESLAKFVQTYPKSGDSAEAMFIIATGSDFSGKDDEAKKWYGQIIANYPGSDSAVKATGAIRRIDAVGKAFVLASPTLAGEKSYTVAPGKVTVVYYWASFSAQAVGDFATLTKLQQTFGKDLEVVGVNLDDKADDAKKFLGRFQLNAPHLHQPGKDGGMTSPLATYYGIFGLPHVFLLDRDGKVVSAKLQVGALEDEITKLTKK